MDKQEAASKLRELTSWMKNSTEYISVIVRDNYYQVDLGAFGQQDLEVEVEDNEYEIDVEEFMNNSPVSISEIDDLADELEEEPEEVTLDEVLARMEEGEDEPKRRLAVALRAVADAFFYTAKQTVEKVAERLPFRPLPWPGALRDDIDYTAADFPLRFQPPPGFVWATGSGNGQSPENAVLTPVSEISNNVMILDNQGRVSWSLRGSDTLAEGGRWRVWHRERDGIPKGVGFGFDTPPRALSAEGDLIATADDKRGVVRQPFKDEDTERKAKKRLKQLAEIGELVKKIDYDPATVELGLESRSMTTDLRVGDFINGYGRVLDVKQAGEDYDIEYRTSGGEDLIEYRENYNWVMRPIATVDGVTREERPTALSLNAPPLAGVDYDPLTVPVKPTDDYVKTRDLRLGDNITGVSFGRVVAVEPYGDAVVTLVMDRDGGTNRVNARLEQNWEVEQIDVEDRDSVPTAISLIEEPVPAAF